MLCTRSSAMVPVKHKWNVLTWVVLQAAVCAVEAGEERIISSDQNEEGRLWKHLFQTKGYNFKVRPVKDVHDAVNITMDVAVNQIIDFDEPRMVLTSETWMRLYWRDDLLTWNASEFSNLTSILVPARDIWLPDLSLYSSVVVPPGGVFGNTNLLVLVSSNGNIKWLFPTVIQSRCSVDMGLFPFDTQRCDHEFGSWSHSGEKIDMHPQEDVGDASNYMDNGEWELVGLPSTRKVQIYKCCPVPFPSVIYSYVLRRRPMYYVFNMALPCFLITVVNLFSFLLPVESGEKISFNITTLLALVVFLRMIADYVPPQAGVVPVIQCYFGICIAILCMSTIVAVFVYRIHVAGESGAPLPIWARRIVYGPIGRVICLDKSACPDVIQSEESKVTPMPDRKSSTPLHRRVNPLSGNCHRGTQTVNVETKAETDSVIKTLFKRDGVQCSETRQQWKDFGHCVDRLFFVILSLVLFGITLFLLTFIQR